jgi:thiol-disulfide isomerase/thioredoxin
VTFIASANHPFDLTQGDEMLHSHFPRRAGGLLLLGFLLAFPGPGCGRPEDKPKESDTRFPGSPTELKLTDGKVTHTTELTKDDPLGQERRYKVFAVRLEKDGVYRIDLKDAGENAKFDPFLFLETPAGKVVDADDDSGGGNDARILVKIPKTDTYRIVATTSDGPQTGKFKLELVQSTDANEIKVADIKFRIKELNKLTAAQRKTLVGEVTSRLKERGADIGMPDVQLAYNLGNELELVDLDSAKTFYPEAIKLIKEASNARIAAASKAFENSLKTLDRLGKPIEITGKTVDDKEFDLKALKGKVVLVDFWATWCGPCVAEIPNMKAAYEKYHSKGFEVIGISLDRSDAAITKFTTAQKIPWACINVADSKKLADKYEVNAIPHPVLVGADGKVVSVRARGPALEKLLERLLGEK